MTHNVEPLLRPVELADLRPTQMTVGFAEVARKRRLWREHIDSDGPDFLGRHMIPVVRGPKDIHWIVDHHHLAVALYQEGVAHVFVSIVANLSHLKRSDFFTFMGNRNWLHPYDAQGELCSVKMLPKNIRHIADDPYRSLAGEVRRASGYAKTDMPYSEFLWADFFRGTIGHKSFLNDPEKAFSKAIILAHSEKASHLPGYCGPYSKDRD